jgi:hypothetical protein
VSAAVLPNAERTGRGGLSSSWVLWFSATAFALVNLLVSWRLVVDATTETGDSAADSLMATTAFTQTDGIYSRWGYHHPGPVLLWMERLSELLLPWLPPFGAHMVMAVTLTTLAVAVLVVAVAPPHATRFLASGGFAVALVVLLDGSALIPYTPTFGNWFFLLAGAGVVAELSGRSWGLPVAVVAGLALVQLHVLYVPLGLAAVALAVAHRVIRLGDPSKPSAARTRTSGLLTAGLGALMLLPLFVDLVLGDSEWLEYARTGDQLGGAAYRSPAKSLQAALEVIAPGTQQSASMALGGAAVLVCAAGALVHVILVTRGRLRLGAGVAIAGIAYTILLSPLDFVTPFSFGRAALVVAGLVLLGALAERLQPVRLLAVSLVGMLVLVPLSAPSARWAPGRSGAGAAETVMAEFRDYRGRNPSAVLVIRHTDHPRAYIGAAATALLAARTEQPYCVASRRWPYWVEDELLCEVPVPRGFVVSFTSLDGFEVRRR